MTLRELLKKSYWNSSDIGKVAGVTRKTASKTLTKSQELCRKDGFGLASEHTVFNKYVIKELGIDLEWLEHTGALDTELEKEK